MKTQILYFYAGLTLAAFFTTVYLLYSNLKWDDFFDIAGMFLPMAMGLIFSASLLFAGIYLIIKGINQAKEKNM